MPKEQWVPHQRDTWPWRIGRLKAATPLMSPARYEPGKGMVSRMGDVGITDDLNADTGYKARVLLSDLEEEKNAESV